MPYVLYPTLPLEADETPTSFLSRLAQQHKAGYARMLAKDIGLDFQKIVDGDEAELSEFARLSGASSSALMANAITACCEAWRLKGQTLLKTSMQRTAPRVCPCCIAVDIAPANKKPEILAYGRALWEIVSVRTCPIHQVPLIEAAQAPHANYAHDFALVVGAVAQQIAAGAQGAPRRALSSLETYLIDRLAGIVGRAKWLDSLEFAAVARLCEIVGAVERRGVSARLKKMTDDDWYVAGGVGFDILSGGEAALTAWLSRLQANFTYSRSGTEGPQALYGDFYKWLAFGAPDPVFDPIRAVVRKHIVATLPVNPGDMVFADPVWDRKLHSLYSAAIEYKLHPKRLRKILAAAGLIDPDSTLNDNRLLFDAALAKPILEAEADAISQSEAETFLNAGRVQTNLLVKRGFITPLPATPDDAHERFSKKAMQAFLDRLGADAVPVDVPGPDQFDIPAAAKRANCRADEIIDLILSNRLVWVGRLTSETGYRAILVDVDEVKMCVQAEPLDGFTARQLEKELRTTTKVVTALIARGLFRQEERINPVNRCPVKIIPRDQVDAFNAEYVSLTNLATERGIHFRALNNELAAAGITPALDRETYGATFFRRADVEQQSAPGPTKNR